MDKETFYRRLIHALLRSDFRLQARDLSQGDGSPDPDQLSAAIGMAAQLAPFIVSALTGIALPKGITHLHPIFDQEGVQQRLNKVREYAAVVCFKYLLAQPVIVAVVDADQLAQEEIITIANRFDDVTLELLEFTGKMGGINLGGIHLGGTRLSVTGIILLVFFDHASASRFIKSTQKRCKILHLWRKTWVLPWVVDVSRRVVIKHSGLPFLPGVLSRDYLQKELFQEP